MVIAINDTSNIPIYMQIRDQIVVGISNGSLSPGEYLPSVRALAEEIGINSMTVNKSYQLLKQEGFIVTDRRKGARISDTFHGRKGLSEENRILLKRIISEAKLSGMTKEAFFGECETYFGEANDL